MTQQKHTAQSFHSITANERMFGLRRRARPIPYPPRLYPDRISDGIHTVRISPQQHCLLLTLMCFETAAFDDIADYMWVDKEGFHDPERMPEPWWKHIHVVACSLNAALKPFGWVAQTNHQHGYMLLTDSEAREYRATRSHKLKAIPRPYRTNKFCRKECVT